MQRILWAVEFNWRGTNSSPHNRCSDLALGRVWEKMKRRPAVKLFGDPIF